MVSVSTRLIRPSGLPHDSPIRCPQRAVEPPPFPLLDAHYMAQLRSVILQPASKQTTSGAAWPQSRMHKSTLPLPSAPWPGSVLSIPQAQGCRLVRGGRGCADLTREIHMIVRRSTGTWQCFVMFSPDPAEKPKTDAFILASSPFCSFTGVEHHSDFRHPSQISKRDPGSSKFHLWPHIHSWSNP